MEQNKNQELVLAQTQMLGADVVKMQETFAVACQMADGMQLQNNACAAFQAVVVVQRLRNALTDGIMNAVFMPLMNTTIGFRTDKDPNKPGKNGRPTPYDVNTVRDCIIDGICMGLMSTGNQMNIIAGRCYPTKEGYTALLKKIGCKYVISVGQDQQRPEAAYAEIPCKINFEQNGEPKGLNIIATVKKDSYSSMDQLRGKAERRAKKSLYEYLTGCDFGDADEDSGAPISATQQTRVTIQAPQQPQPSMPAPSQPAQAPQQAPQPAQTQQQVMNNAGQQAQANWRQQRSQAPQNNAPKF